MRLELNLPALERLLGGDTEIEVGLRQQIGEEFCKKHLKSMLNDATYRKVSAEWESQLKAAIDEAVTGFFNKKQDETDGTWTANRLQWSFEKVIGEAVNKAMADHIAKTIAYQTRQFSRELNSAVDAAMSAEIEKRIEEGVQKRLTAALAMKG